jgi:surfeit locus 1 family protein
MWSLARRPRWIAALVLCLAIAGAFAALGQWQLSNSLDRGVAVDERAESLVPLGELAEPQQALTTEAAGRRVSIEAALVPGDYVVLEGRLHEGTAGYWLVGHLVEQSRDGAGASLAVALGWAANEEAVASAARALNDEPRDWGGRYYPSESPQEDDFENGETNSLSTASLVNLWEEAPNGVYAGYLVTDDAAPGLEEIDAPAPSTELSVNWLNIFYAIEWAVFAGFAIFLWFRLVRDAWERETEEAEEREQEAAARERVN